MQAIAILVHSLMRKPVLIVVVIATVFGLTTATAFMQKSTPSIPIVPPDPAVSEAMAEPAKTEQAAKEEEAGNSPIVNPDLITATTYGFANASAVALEDMSSGTTQLVAANLDDTASAVTNLGFDFWYDGVRFTQFSVNANGLCRLGSAAVSTSFDNSTAFASTTNAPKIAPYFDDLWVGTNGKVHFKVIGSAPSRKLVVEWLNMQIPRVASGNAGAGTFQMWLFETTGVIEFVYGSGVALNSTNSGYSIGLQSGAATNFASVTSTGPTVSYVAANNTQTNAITSGTKYTFTPNVPSAPTDLNFTSVMATSMTLNWTDVASNEVGYAIYQSTDNVNFTFVTQTAANASSQNVTGLNPSTTYFWQVYAVTEGALSTALTGSQATAAPGSLISAQSGLWNDTATWGGSIPTVNDNVTIATGHTVTINSSNALNVTVQSGGILQFEDTTARTLTVGQSVTINSGGTFQTASTGTQTGHVLSVGTNLTNNGPLDFSTNGNTAGATITFTGAANRTFGGTGATTDIRAITVNKGTSSASVVELNPTNFSVQGVTTDVAGFLTLTNGTLKISGTFTMTNRTFPGPTYIIPTTGGIWLNNPNYTVAATASGSTTANNGLFMVSQGAYNIGVGAGDQMRGGAGAAFTIEGGTVNCSGAFDPQSAVVYTQTGGTLNCGVVGNNVSNFGTFELFSSATTFIMSGGTINIINPSTGTTKVDYRNNAPTANTNITGGTVVIGATGAPAMSIYTASGQMPSTTANATQTMRVNNGEIFMRGTTVTNSGAIDYTGASARYDFACVNSAMTYGGGGIFGTAATPVAGVGISANSTFQTTLNSPIICNRVNLFQGGFINSNQITLGNGATSTTVVQIGSTGLTTPGGSFDVSPNHLQGTGGEILLYAFETAKRTTGVEINPTRVLTSISLVDNPNNVIIAGGDLTLSSTAAALVLTNGRLITGLGSLMLSSGTATVTRTNGYVDGKFTKAFAAAASKTFEVGTANGYSPVTVNVTAGTFPANFTVKAVQGPQPNVGDPAKALQRYWKLIAAGLTADLTFNYLDPTDIPGTATEANFAIFAYDTTGTFPGGSVNAAANTATITGVTMFSDWTLIESGACPTSIDKVSQSFPANGGMDSFMVAAAGGCSWTAVSNDPSFITVTSGSGMGAGTVNYTVAANAALTNRSGSISIGSRTYIVVQGAAFLDVPANDIFYEDIGKLSARGITVGCGGGNYCPNDPVTREQMAAFIIRALGEFCPATPATQRFADVPPSNIFYEFIDRLAVLGITVGCGGNNYCPTSPVLREQMAAFILRGLGEFSPPTPGSQRFNDVPPANVFYNFIDRMAVLNITLGCTPDHTLYCPADPVTRAQMAAFLVRAYGL